MDARELTRDEKKKIRTLVTGMCANYDRESGLCLPLDCACYMLHKCWTGAYCRYFREAVLPLNPELQAALTTEGISPESVSYTHQMCIRDRSTKLSMKMWVWKEPISRNLWPRPEPGN